ncbi:LPS export ABC transporter ATP-binding protein [Spirochaeta cellobiosiphila]|uniref:LPS export ABC transporter ATP-binding protein n=1 Tax=Spirochaeta cellobiosiphila TaxID=504483 RepID=UPI000408813B|nr:LPS export ABC transporter ATP-binding protein [Spirochaeta cellobiosiphila]
MNSETLQVLELRKEFGKKVAVKNVSFSMNKGEVVGLLGPNGAGKTTIFYMIAGFITPTKGIIKLNNQNITKVAMYKRARQGISYLPQEASVFRKLSVENNIYSILETRQDLSKIQKKETLNELIDELGLDHIRKQHAYTLSGGERRRTEIARALAIEPHFLLLDEPFAGIDPIAVGEIKGIIKKLADKDIGVLITDHNVHYTLEITHRSYIINQGEILVSGSRNEIINNDLAKKFYLGQDFKMYID